MVKIKDKEWRNKACNLKAHTAKVMVMGKDERKNALVGRYLRGVCGN